MWIYTFLLVWVFLILQNQERYKKNKVFLAMLPLMLLSALRSINIGNDTKIYHNLYNTIKGLDLSQAIRLLSSRWETGFIVFIKAVSKLGSNPQILVVCTAIIFFLILSRVYIDYSKNIWLSIFLFVTMRYYFFTMSNIRQTLAFTFIIIAYEFLQKKDYLTTILLTVLASLFHLSSAIFFLLIIVDRFGWKSKMSYVTFIVIIIIFLSWDRILNLMYRFIPSQYINYFNTSYYLEANNIANLMNFAVILVITILIFYEQRKFRNNENVSTIDIYIPVLSIVFALFAIKFTMFARCQYYFSIFLTIMLPNTLKSMKSSRKRAFIEISVVIMFLLYHYIILIYRPEWQHVYPYEFFWSIH